ncbi:MAG: hypothetical protein LBC72_03865 [Spirochaetaceae bacterium]|nr:hypothetical protein [Spirochaetaceae bacterium]
MNKYLNYEDNIFILNTRVRMIQDLLALDADAGIFLDKTIEDCEFIGKSSAVLLDSLLTNKQLIERDEQLHNLYEMETRFSNVLFSMLHSNASFSVRVFPDIEQAVAAMSESAAKRIAVIDSTMKEMPSFSVENRAVSKDELVALLGSG